MKTAIFRNRGLNVTPVAPDSRFSDFSQLTKARLTFLVLVTTGVGFYLGSRGPLDLMGLFNVLFGSALAAAGASALNQWWERDLDALMSRTSGRPVPSGRMLPLKALILGGGLSLAGVVYLFATANPLAAALAAATVIIYIFAYTPLKRLTTINTLIGAIPGALPPLIGWAAAQGRLDLAAWSLFVILFTWQMPHFFAIAWIYRDDYERAGFRMLSREDESGARSASQAVLFCMLLLIVAGIPTAIGLSGPVYLLVEVILGACFTAVAMRFHRSGSLQDARLLFFSSIIYLPLLLAALVLTKQ
ncbi:MAG: heme o synthase [Verrucomicrobiota bacterium]|jgi:protoheme IX farnesyltransferase